MIARTVFTKIIAIQLSLLLLVVMAGFHIEVHWCGGEIAEIKPSYSSNQKGTDNACCGEEETSNKCCHNEHLEWKQQSPHWFHQHVLAMEWVACVPNSSEFIPVSENTNLSFRSIYPLRPKQSHAPPPYILFSKLIFYA
ncbi:MAG: hypothetical protein CFE24_02140 [Flavobacterium sp. BFFFF2]|nr:MAG: hypothetical protein CFE24_02140 [Flavobacterium sp. BFFFF2]